MVEARTLLRHHWTRGAFARDYEGTPVGVHSDRAVSFDLLGAIAHVARDPITYKEAVKSLSECIDESMSTWNDEATLGEVLASLSDAIGTMRCRNDLFFEEEEAA